MGNIPWYTGSYELPRALAKRRQELAPFELGGQLAGGVGQLLRATKERTAEEDQQNAEMEALKAQLGIGQEPQPKGPTQQQTFASPSPENAEQQSTPGLDSTISEEARSAAEIDPSSDQTRGADVSAQAEGGQPQSAAGVIQAIRGKPAGPLRRIAETALVGLGLKRDQERAGRLAEMGALKGRAERERQQRITAGQFAGIAGKTKDPGALFQKVAPGLNLGPGDIEMLPEEEKLSTEQWVQKNVGGDFNRAIEIVERLKRAGRGGEGGGGRNPNKEQLAYMAANGDLKAKAALDMLAKDDPANELYREILKNMRAKQGGAAPPGAPGVGQPSATGDPDLDPWE